MARKYKKWDFQMETLIYRDVVRKYLVTDFVWLTKVSSTEFHRWRRTFIACYFRIVPENEIDAKIEAEIEHKEFVYQQHVELRERQREKSKELDAEIHDKIHKIQDLVSIPSNPEAVLVMGNGRTYPPYELKDVFSKKKLEQYETCIRLDKYEPVTGTTKQHCYTDWMCGDIELGGSLPDSEKVLR